MKKVLLIILVSIMAISCSSSQKDELINQSEIIYLNEPSTTLYEQDVNPVYESAVSVRTNYGTTLWDIAGYATGDGDNWIILFDMNNMSTSRLWYRDRGNGPEPMVTLQIGEEIFIPSHWKSNLPQSIHPLSLDDVTISYRPSNLNLLVVSDFGKAYLPIPKYDKMLGQGIDYSPAPVTEKVEGLDSSKLGDENNFWHILWKVLIALFLLVIIYLLLSRNLNEESHENESEEYDITDNELLSFAIDTAYEDGHGFKFSKDANGGLKFTTTNTLKDSTRETKSDKKQDN